MKKFYFTLLFLSIAWFGFGQSAEVGLTEGELSVSLTGAANYKIPIAVPPGIKGVVPQVSLVYNSQGGNGIAGYGWNISGVSTISRVPSTKFHDGVIDPVDFNTLDRFAFDGQRLLIKNGTSGIYGSNETLYETESFSNIKITSYGTHPNGVNYGPAYFVVEYPDGSKAYYGNSVDSRSLLEWAITYWENPQGVRINYNYTATNNVLDISSIKYGTLSSSTPVNEIQFSYSTRKRPEQSYVGNQNILKNNILNNIKVFSNGVGYRNYFLEYETTYKDYQRLIKITEKNGDNSKSYNPTIFTYGPLVDNSFTNTAPANLDLTNLDYETMGNVSGDFDGDGKTDVILYPKKTINAKKKYWLYKDISSAGLNVGFEHNTGEFAEIFPTSILEGNSVSVNKLMTKQGWTVLKYGSNTNSITFSVYSSSLTLGIGLQYEKIFTFPQLVYHPEFPSNCQETGDIIPYIQDISKTYLSGDFNGDGLTDIVAIEYDCQFSYLKRCTINDPYPTSVTENYYGMSYFINMDKRLTTDFVFGSGGLNIDDTYKLKVADVNGDGKEDIIAIKNGLVKVFSLNNQNVFVQLFTKTDSAIATSKIILYGDFNGDGKTDFVIPTALGQDDWNFYISTGTSFNKISGAIGLKYNQSEVKKYYQDLINNNDWTYSLNENTYVANDFNGDGKTDILNQQNFTVESDQSGAPNPKPKGTPQMTKFQIVFNMGFGVSDFKFMSTLQFYYAANKVERYPIPVLTNVNDLSKSFKYSLITGSKMYSMDFVWYNKLDVLLKKITNGNGVTETISYVPLDTKSRQGPNQVYFSASDLENYPSINILNDPNFFVVSMLEKNSTASYKKKLFQYYGAVSNVEGLGFLGFKSTAQTNWHNDTNPIISYISKNDISLRGANIENYSALGQFSPQANVSGNYITKSVIDYNLPTDALQTNKVFKLKTLALKEINALNGTSTETSLNYDIYNNVLSSTVVTKEGASTIQTKASAFTYNSPGTSPFVMGQLSGSTQSITIPGDVMTTEELYTYSNNLLTQIKKKGAGTNYITEDNVYDAFGNITKKTISATGLTPRVTNYEYDSSGRFMTKDTDIEGLSTIYTYNSNNGLLTSETNPYGQVTSYTYDSWGKIIKVTDYLNKNRTYSYSRNAEKTVVTSSGDSGGSVEETFDDLGRKINTASSGMQSFNYNKSFLYDIYDRAIRISEPYVGVGWNKWSEIKFDEYGRNIQNISYTGRTTNISYSGLTATVSNEAQTKIITKNAIGRVISLTETPGETINYTYFANGNLKETDYGGVKTTILQDGWGRKTQLTDTSAGTYTYEYNDFGETTKETTPNGTTAYKLNDVGKLDEKTILGTNSNSKTIYYYDSSTKLLTGNKYEDFINGNTIINDYTYDSFKRISTTQETTPYATFKKELTYDGFGRIYTEKSTASAAGKSSSNTIKNTYRDGFHWQILDNTSNAVLWQTDAIDGRGNLCFAKSGPVKIDFTMDDYGHNVVRKYELSGPSFGNPNILTLNTFFNPKTGNLTSRDNEYFDPNVYDPDFFNGGFVQIPWKEEFKYDANDRLIEYTNVAGEQEEQSYYDNGRIKKNSLGEYNYAITAKPYQNTSITLSQEAVGSYGIREGIFFSSMEEKKGWMSFDDLFNDPLAVKAYSYDDTKAYSGKNSIKINSTYGDGQFVFSEKMITINNTAPTQYTYSAWVFTDNPEAEMILNMRKEGEFFLGNTTDSVKITTTGVWTPITKTVLVPADVKQLRITLSNNGIGNVWFDDVQIRKTSQPSTTVRALNITYNTFKAPVDIEETGVDKISFCYNDANNRTAMFYGSLETDKLLRPYRKYYSEDGTMEIKQNLVSGELDFVTYIGGDGYTAPVVVKSDGTTQNYLYLQRDYQGSILGITDRFGGAVEKRLYDAWGNLAKLEQDIESSELLLDRGYTGHEHLQSVGLINMNGRLYDP
ncbi:hypothetical protein GSY47_00445, partial [Flavobacterium quisquiliarum]